MKKTLVIFAFIFLSGCTEYRVVHNYKLEKYQDSEVPVCVDYKQRLKIVDHSFAVVDTCGNNFTVPEEYEETGRECDILGEEVVSYSYCLAQLPKPVHLVEKKKDDMTICYDRNNKIELPILYCQKDMINIQMTEVRQQTTVLQNTTLKW